MAQVGRAGKNLESPRPLKTSMRVSHHAPAPELQSIEELITLIESVADSVSIGQCNPDEMGLLLSNLRIHGLQLEDYSKSTLDQAFVKFRNASQDERLSIITRMNLLELIELRAKSWQVSDGINTYYKTKASDVQPESFLLSMSDTTLLGSSPPSGVPAQILLSPGEIIRTSGKFQKPTKIPGKNYSKDEVVIRNSDSGKVMGIKGRRVHMIEELSETIISFQRVSPGAKERLVQITGPSEEKITCAKQLIEDTIRRNASPIPLEEGMLPVGAESTSSIASSASDEQLQKSLSIPVNGDIFASGKNVLAGNYFIPNSNLNFAGDSNTIQVAKLRRANSGGQILLHSLSTNDASLGEYKYTVNIGNHSIKITGDCLDLVRVSKLVLDEYFTSSEFLTSVEAGSGYDSNLDSSPSTPFSTQSKGHIPLLSSSSTNQNQFIRTMSIPENEDTGSIGQIKHSADADDDVFIVEDKENETSLNSSQRNTVNQTVSAQSNGLNRSRRSHFSHGDSLQENNETTNLAAKDSLSASQLQHHQEQLQQQQRISYENERLIFFSKSPHSWAVPRDWMKICDKYPNIIRSKDSNSEKKYFDVDKYLQLKSGRQNKKNMSEGVETEEPHPTSDQE